MGFAAAAPFVFKSLTCPLAGVIADLLRRNILSTKTVRRVFYTTGIAQFLKVGNGKAESQWYQAKCSRNGPEVRNRYSRPETSFELHGGWH